MIREELQGHGEFQFRLQNLTHSRFATLDTWQTMYVLPAVAFREGLTQAEIESRAYYAGVLLDKNSDSGDLIISGADLSWWIGDAVREGPIVTSPISFEMALPSVVISVVWQSISPIIPLGDVTNPPDTVPQPTWTGTIPMGATAREVLDVIASDCYCTWKMNIDGTIDFGPADDVFETANPKLIHGKEETSKEGLKAEAINSYSSGRVSNQILVDTVEGVASASIPSIFTGGYKGNAVERASMVTSTMGGQNRTQELAKRLLGIKSRLQLGSTFAFENEPVALREINIGDTVHVYDPVVNWEATGVTADIGAIVSVQPLVVSSKIWNFDQQMTMLVVSSTGTVLNITQWVEKEPPGLSFVCGDRLRTFGWNVLGSEDVTTPVANIFEG